MRYPLLAGNDTGHLQFSWFAFGKKRFPGKFHAFAGGKHRVDQKQCLVIQRGSGNVFDVYIYNTVFIILVETECGTKALSAWSNIFRKPVCRGSPARNTVAITICHHAYWPWPVPSGVCTCLTE
mgnify:CR=1 FL=1